MDAASFVPPCDCVLFLESSWTPESFVYEHHQKLKNLCSNNILVVYKYSFLDITSDNPQDVEITFLCHPHQNAILGERICLSQSPIFSIAKEGQAICIGTHTATIQTKPAFFQDLYATFLQKSLFSLIEPMAFRPCFIPKPWGQEIWFTGVEKRGISQIARFFQTEHKNDNNAVPLPWFISAFPQTICGFCETKKGLVLIKILDPSCDPILGNLYYELHQEKNEVYVVTNISKANRDPGYMKLGIDAKKIAQYQGQPLELKKDFLDAIKNYENIRNKIDALPAHSDIPSHWQDEESARRQAMNAFVGYLTLNVGDVVAIPTLVPHALQHGVRVVEFQTPTYERLIMSFEQKVLTQPHWDSDRAVELMSVQAPSHTQLKIREKTTTYLVEEVCSFPDFFALRITLQENSVFTINACNSYQICFFVAGQALLEHNTTTGALQPESCILLPSGQCATVRATTPSVFLVCVPCI